MAYHRSTGQSPFGYVAERRCMVMPSSMGTISVHRRHRVPPFRLSYIKRIRTVLWRDYGERTCTQLAGSLSEQLPRKCTFRQRRQGNYSRRMHDGQSIDIRPLDSYYFSLPNFGYGQRICRSSGTTPQGNGSYASRTLGTIAGMDVRLGWSEGRAPPHFSFVRTLPQQSDFPLPYSWIIWCSTYFSDSSWRPVDRVEHGMESLPLGTPAWWRPRLQVDNWPADSRTQWKEKRRHLP